jgi:rare lipoprotein A
LADSTAIAFGNVSLPDFGPIAPERPVLEGIGETRIVMASLSYAEGSRQGSASPFAALEGHGLTAAAVAESWKRMNEDVVEPVAAEPYVAAGSFTIADEANRLASALAAFGRIEIEKSEVDGMVWYSVNLRADGRTSLDGMLEAAWANGASDAMTIRD